MKNNTSLDRLPSKFLVSFSDHLLSIVKLGGGGCILIEKIICDMTLGLLEVNHMLYCNGNLSIVFINN